MTERPKRKCTISNYQDLLKGVVNIIPPYPYYDDPKCNKIGNINCEIEYNIKQNLKYIRGQNTNHYDNHEDNEDDDDDDNQREFVAKILSGLQNQILVNNKFKKTYKTKNNSKDKELSKIKSKLNSEIKINSIISNQYIQQTKDYFILNNECIYLNSIIKKYYDLNVSMKRELDYYRYQIVLQQQ
jgi:hypothetical protein